MSFHWTSPVVARCRELWLAGYSASEVAKTIGAPSRAAVIAQMARQGVKRDPLVNQEARRIGGRATAAKRSAKAACCNKEDLSLARPRIEREPGQCAFPVAGEGADTLSCCHPTSGVYCAAHRRRMTVV
jgi:hypothetical protein